MGTLSMFAPYGCGRFLSLFRSKLDTLTIQYLRCRWRAARRHLHVPGRYGRSDQRRTRWTRVRTQASRHRGIRHRISPTKRVIKIRVKPARAAKPAKINASAITVMMIQSDEIKLPAEFQVSLYENLIRQLQKKGGFQHVYREGDRNSAGAPNGIVLHSTVRGFKQGSEMARRSNHGRRGHLDQRSLRVHRSGRPVIAGARHQRESALLRRKSESHV